MPGPTDIEKLAASAPGAVKKAFGALYMACMPARIVPIWPEDEMAQ